MSKPRVSIGQVRRAQIVEAAVAVIAEKGLQHLSLSEIETKADMSRGQLTYYFHTKEDILLAVFDRMLEMMRARAHTDVEGSTPGPCAAHGWERMCGFLTWFVLTPPDDADFSALQHTFLSQIGHRDDFRARLANLYEEWRRHLAADVAEEATLHQPAVSSRTVASFVQAILHGLAMQRAADPNAYDRQEMLTLCLDLLGNYLRPPSGRAATTSAGRHGPSNVPPRTARAAGEGKA